MSWLQSGFSELFFFMADDFPILDRYTAIYAFLAQLFRVWKKKTIHAIFSFENNAFGRKRFFLAPRAFEKTTEEHGFLHSHTHQLWTEAQHDLQL